jgi:hypothetical protein
MARDKRATEASCRLCVSLKPSPTIVAENLPFLSSVPSDYEGARLSGGCIRLWRQKWPHGASSSSCFLALRSRSMRPLENRLGMCSCGHLTRYFVTPHQTMRPSLTRRNFLEHSFLSAVYRKMTAHNAQQYFFGAFARPCRECHTNRDSGHWHPEFRDFYLDTVRFVASQFDGEIWPATDR